MNEDKAPNPVDVYVGSRLKMRRTMLGVSQTKIGEIIGVTFQQIQKYETGINRVASSRLYQFSQILLVPISYFFEGYNEEAVNPANKKLEKEVSLVVKHFIQIPEEKHKKAVIALAKSLVGGKSE